MYINFDWVSSVLNEVDVICDPLLRSTLIRRFLIMKCFIDSELVWPSYISP